MTVTLSRTVSALRSTRDLRAEILALAARLGDAPKAQGRLVVIAPKIGASTIQEEWDRALPVLQPGIQARLALVLDVPQRESSNAAPGREPVPLRRPNYRHEVLRLLVEGELRSERFTLANMAALLGVSQTPVRNALAALRAAGLATPRGVRLQLRPEELSTELLARAEALPQVLRLRFVRGSQLRPPAELLERARSLLLRSTDDGGWGRTALSGVAAAQLEVPWLDLMGLPRLDLLIQVSHRADDLELSFLRKLDDGLQPETDVLAPAPASITLVRANLQRARPWNDPPMAPSCDIFFSLLDLGLHAQARQYAKAVRA